MAGPRPRNGTWVSLMPAMLANSSAARWAGLPAPPLP